MQPQEVPSQLGGMAADTSIGSRRIAVLVSKTLTKLQVRRIAPDYGLFSEWEEAMRWLFEPNG